MIFKIYFGEFTRPIELQNKAMQCLCKISQSLESKNRLFKSKDGS